MILAILQQAWPFDPGVILQIAGVLLGAGIVLQRVSHLETRSYERHEELKDRRREDLQHIDDEFQRVEKLIQEMKISLERQMVEQNRVSAQRHRQINDKDR